jgi:hypothetical protein
MFSRIHEKLGTAGFVISIVALIAALTGGAYAAGALNPQIKKQITKESRKFSKKFSKQFAKEGPQGAKGDTGAQGAPGSNGAPGPAGSPWTAGGVLPKGKTETGAWAFGVTASNSAQLVSVSFNIPLEAAPDIHVINASGKEKVFNETASVFEEIVQPDCPGEATEPEAAPGTLCLYVSKELNLFWGEYPPITESYATGAVIAMLPSATEARASGTWAVTAP